METLASHFSTPTSQSASDLISSLGIEEETIPLAIGAVCLVAGFIAGSGHWGLFGRTAKNLTRSYGTLLLNAAYESFKQKGNVPGFQSNSPKKV